MSEKMRILGITALAVLLLAGTAMAQPPGGWNPPGGGAFETDNGPGGGGPGQGGGNAMEILGRFRMMFRELDLTDSQVDEIHSIVDTAREDARAIMEAAGGPEERTPFMEIFTSPVLTAGDLEEVIGQNSEIRDAIQEIILEAIVDVHDVLTAEQLEELASMAEEHSFGMGGHGPGHMPGR
jgi:Spy/CpxP family protein refolding chaperone